jgi:DNA-binding MarR family transcriptional regulator
MREGLSQKDLAYLLGIRPQSLTEALAHLEETGLVERRHNERDARVINVFLTDAGRERAAKVAEDRKKSAADVFSVLDEDEKEQLGVILDKLTVGLEEQLSGRKPGNVGDAAE